MHSKAKLALAVITQPGAAFEEILERKLLGTAIFIVVLTGFTAALSPLILASHSGPLQYFLLGKNNPLCWLGLCMLYAFILSKLLTWIGTEIDYQRVLTIMGWSQILLLLNHVITTIGAGIMVSGQPNPNVVNFMSAAYMALSLWYVASIGLGIRSATGAPLTRGVLTYLVVAMAAGIAFSFTYSSALLTPFEHAPAGTAETAKAIVGADMGPWLVTGVIGLIIGIWQLGKSLEWDRGLILRLAASALVIGAAAIFVYMNAFWSPKGIYQRLSLAGRQYVRAQRIYQNNKADWFKDASVRKSADELYEKAASGLAALLPVVKDNAGLVLDLGDLNYLAGKQETAISYYRKFMKMVKDADLAAASEKQTLARAYIGIGAAHDADGRYEAALSEFEKAAKAWPKLRDPWVRMAVTHDRMGDYDKAIKNADHALKKLDSEAVVGWVAAAQAYTATGDLKQAKASIAIVESKDEDLAKRIGSKAEDWENAVSKLTRQDLLFPLERAPVAAPEKKQPEKAKPKKRG